VRSPPGADLLQGVRNRTSARLAAVAERFSRMLCIGSSLAPGLQCIGGEIALEDDAAAACGTASLSVTGNGETREAALASCLGEAADLLSQFERSGDVAASGQMKDFPGGIGGGWIAQALARARGDIDWIEGRNAATGGAVLLPADFCLRREPRRRTVEPAAALSAGSAAGPNFEAAAVRAVLELCERDAAALWWLGGCRPRDFLVHDAAAGAAALLGRLRRHWTGRAAWLLDLTTDVEIPVVAALSADADGRGLACGLAARLDPAEAAQAAVLEMCQMELAAPVAAAKRAEGGDAALNDTDRRHLARAAFAARECALLCACEPSRLALAPPATGAELQVLIDRLMRRGVEVFLADFTRPDLGIPVARALAPQLQPFAESVATERLAHARRASGGAHAAVATVPLF
jgi:thiazole/oxazole-forming peptide maturase SagD family component